MQVAECLFSAHSEEWLLKALLENCDWHLSPSTKATSDEIIRYGVTIRDLIPLTKCSISLRLNAIEACHYALYVLCTLGPNGYYLVAIDGGEYLCPAGSIWPFSLIKAISRQIIETGRN